MKSKCYIQLSEYLLQAIILFLYTFWVVVYSKLQHQICNQFSQNKSWDSLYTFFKYLFPLIGYKWKKKGLSWHYKKSHLTMSFSMLLIYQTCIFILHCTEYLLIFYWELHLNSPLSVPMIAKEFIPNAMIL